MLTTARRAGTTSAHFVRTEACAAFLENDTRVGLRHAPAGRPPSIEHFAIKVVPFDRGPLERRLHDLGATMLPADDEPDVVRFLDNNGIVVELLFF